MQPINQSSRVFSERTDALATALKMSLRDLAPIIGISQAMLFAYRNAKYPISPKAWKKLETAELRALAKTEPAAALEKVEDSLLLTNYGKRPLDGFLRPTEDNVEKIVAALLHAADVTHVWMADTESLTEEWQNHLATLARGQPLDKEAHDEFPSLSATVRRRREKLDLMRLSIARAIESLVTTRSVTDPK